MNAILDIKTVQDFLIDGLGGIAKQVELRRHRRPNRLTFFQQLPTFRLELRFAWSSVLMFGESWSEHFGSFFEFQTCYNIGGETGGQTPLEYHLLKEDFEEYQRIHNEIVRDLGHIPAEFESGEKREAYEYCFGCFYLPLENPPTNEFDIKFSYRTERHVGMWVEYFANRLARIKDNYRTYEEPMVEAYKRQVERHRAGLADPPLIPSMVLASREYLKETLSSYGEDEMAGQISMLSDHQIFEIGQIAFQLLVKSNPPIWDYKALALSAIEVLEGSPRELRWKRRKLKRSDL